MSLKRAVKRCFSLFGYRISRRDRLAEMIPDDYLQSPFLPRVYRESVGRLFYFRTMVEAVSNLAGAVVECGVSIGHGLLYFMLLGELTGQNRRVYGFDSFDGFPASTDDDLKWDGRHQTRRGDYRSSENVVTRVLSDGRIAPALIRDNLTLVRGFFEDTLPSFDDRIALLHLDCDLYQSYRVCLERLYEKVVPSGVVMFDEYEDSNFPGARRAVDEFFADKPEKPTEYDDYGYRKYYVVKQ